MAQRARRWKETARNLSTTRAH